MLIAAHTRNSKNLRPHAIALLRAMTRAVAVALILLIAVLSGCDEATSPFDYRREVVVNATLVAGEHFADVFLTWSGRVDEYYSPLGLGIRGALVIISDAQGVFADTLLPDNGYPGRYTSASFRSVQPRQTYNLYVRTQEPDVRVVTGTTSVPDTFRITASTLHNGDRVRYDLDAPVHSFAWSTCGNFSAYLPTVWSMDANPALIPKAYYGDTASATFKRPSRTVYRIGLPKTQTNTDVPWLFLNYYGRTRFDIFAVDENLADFLRQWLALQTGELKEIRYKLQGGIGLFCSKSRAENGVEVYFVK